MYEAKKEAKEKTMRERRKEAYEAKKGEAKEKTKTGN